MNQLLAIPIALPLVGAVLSLLFRKHIRVQRSLLVSACVTNLVLSVFLLHHVDRSGILVLHVGSWPAPFGITLVLDRLSAVMLVMSGIVGTAISIYSLAAIDAAREKYGYHIFLHVLLMGVNGAFITGDLFNLYVWFEVMLMASFILLTLGGERPQLEGGIKYVAMNFLSSALFLAAVGILYGLAGTLNMADLSVALRDTEHAGIINTVAMLFLVAFGIKAAVFPLFFWLPASYHTPPTPVSAIFAGLLTKVGVYALIRVFTLIFLNDMAFNHDIILLIAGMTMITGVLGAAAQMDVRRILSFHIVSQIGYMIMGLGLFTTLALSGSVFYIIHHIIVKTNLFLVAGVIARRTGTNELKKLGGLYCRMPWLALLFLIPALSLAGLPPLSGFFAKLTLIISALREEGWLIAGTALAVGLLTLFSMMKIWNEVFWKPDPHTNDQNPGLIPWSQRERFLYFAPISALAICTVFIGLGAGYVLDFSVRTAQELMNPAEYVNAVFQSANRP